MWTLFKWFDVGTDWRLGIDRYIRLICIVIMLNWFLDLLYVLPVDKSKTLLDFIFSQLPFGE